MARPLPTFISIANNSNQQRTHTAEGCLMAWHDQRFSDQYKAAQQTLKNSASFDGDWKSLVESLHKLLTDTGFDTGRASALNDLRKKVTQGASKGFLRGHAKITADEGILQGANATSDKATAIPDQAARQRAAALKFLQHVYLLKRFGSHKVWVHSLPNEFDDWAHQALDVQDAGKIKRLLRADNERFTAAQKRDLSDATQMALRWCHLTLTVLVGAGAKKPKDKHVALVKRWFAEPDLDDKGLQVVVAKLTVGFKAITAAINRGQMVFTDFPALRGGSTAEIQSLLDSEAFVWALAGREQLDVVYVENDFFGTQNVLQGRVNWARIIIHELSHLVCGTDDVEPGPRYSWYGIGPNPNFRSTDTVKNADSWAFFAADCANALSETERNTALKII